LTQQIKFTFMTPEEIETKKAALLSRVPDLIADFLYYDRKECEDVSVDDVKDLVNYGHITREEIVKEFVHALNEVTGFKK